MSEIPPMKDSIDLLAMVAKANAWFDALTPEQKRAHREAQRRSWVVGEMMLEHDEMSREEADALYDRVILEGA